MTIRPTSTINVHPGKMVIITSYFTGETYGLLGPQAAATIITRQTPYECLVVTVTNEDDPQTVKKALYDFFGSQTPLVGFSYLSGRPDLLALAAQLKAEGATTLLAGPQSNVDFSGETGCDRHPHRFQGLADHFNFALRGPAEQLVPFLQSESPATLPDIAGALYLDETNVLAENPETDWNPTVFSSIDWSNIYRIVESHLVPIDITAAQVLQQIGCPWAARSKRADIDYPAFLTQSGEKHVHLDLAGCSFCDVATDKGLVTGVPDDAVLVQVESLPETKDGRKIPFELINENPLPGLPHLLERVHDRGLAISQINLTLRADWLLKADRHLQSALEMARDMSCRIVFASIGFESFSDVLLRNLNKGLPVDTNLAAVDLIRRMKSAFPRELGYLRSEGGNHGFIHPTPWDTPATESDLGRIIDQHDLARDILPDHSTPLIIHHASGLGAWIRAIENRENITFTRRGAVVAWWDGPVQSPDWHSQRTYNKQQSHIFVHWNEYFPRFYQPRANCQW